MEGFEGFGILYESLNPRTRSLAESRDVALQISQGVMKYDALESVGSESPIGGPAVPRSKFADGEIVYLHYKVRNDGEVSAVATIKVTDKDTGTLITTYTTPTIAPGYRYEAFKATVGAMPNNNWNLTVAVTP